MKETYEFLKKIKFYKMHIFKFSVRKGTKAEKVWKGSGRVRRTAGGGRESTAID